ncbi:MAG: hypothetical protein AB1Z98_13415 [Nannocystaceae bacterium]
MPVSSSSGMVHGDTTTNGDDDLATGTSGSLSSSTSGGAASGSSGETTSTDSSGDAESTTGPGEEVICLDPNAGITWAGNWGRVWGAGCFYLPDLPDPVVVDHTSFGSDCTIITAEVWIPGVTDVDGNEALIRRDILIEDPTGVVDDQISWSYFERVGNNYRFGLNFQSGGWFTQPYGTYDLRVRFSYGDMNEGCWYTIGLAGGPDGGAPRTLEWVP